MRLAAALSLILLSGCGGGGGGGGSACPPPLVGSCTSHTGFICTEYAGVPTPGPEALMATCKGDPDKPDVWSSSACNLPGALGACRRMQGQICVAVWVAVPASDPNTRAQAQQMCAAQGGTWIDGY